MKLVNKKNELLFFAVLALVLMVVLALFSGQKKTDPVAEEIAEMESQSDSTKTSAIESDLNDTDLTNLDRELGDIEAEIEAAY